MAWMSHNRFEVDDHVITTKVFMVGPNTYPPGTVGIISDYAEESNYKVRIRLGDGDSRIVTLHEAMLRLWEGDPEADEPEVEFESGATDYVIESIRLLDKAADQSNVASHAMRQVMVADVYARLEQARATHRQADALEKIATALLERSL